MPEVLKNATDCLIIQQAYMRKENKLPACHTQNKKKKTFYIRWLTKT